MSDPVRDFEYARNAVTLTFDLSGYEHVRLAFSALEYGDEPHALPAGGIDDLRVYDRALLASEIQGLETP